MHATRDTRVVIVIKGLGGRVMRGVSWLSFMNFFRDLTRLGYILGHIESLPEGCCLYISGGVEEVDASTLCLPIALDKEDPKDVEWFLTGDALQEFLSATDLEDVIENLRLQQGTFSEAELIAAVNYYWKNDAFIEAAS